MRFLQRLNPARPVDRELFLVSSVRGKTALHLGCVDGGLLQERIDTRTLLHDRLNQSARELWGLDIDEEGLHVLEKRGFKRLHCGSAEEPPAAIPRRYFDVIIAGEIIEHVRNVGLFLDSAASLLREDGCLIITTPNALRFYNPFPAMMGFELVHPDHLAWFSPHTLVQAITRAALAVEAIHTYTNSPRMRVDGTMSSLQRLRRRTANVVIDATHRLCLKVSPHWADGIIVAARPETIHE